ELCDYFAEFADEASQNVDKCIEVKGWIGEQLKEIREKRPSASAEVISSEMNEETEVNEVQEKVQDPPRVPSEQENVQNPPRVPSKGRPRSVRYKPTKYKPNPTKKANKGKEKANNGKENVEHLNNGIIDTTDRHMGDFNCMGDHCRHKGDFNYMGDHC
ncbi:hypothetical protein MKW94_005276, partial [Papaver nudicaule]|nr:hypothetical protein [Papaver nudicaule]